MMPTMAGPPKLVAPSLRKTPASSRQRAAISPPLVIARLPATPSCFDQPRSDSYRLRIAKRRRQIICEIASGGFRRTTGRENGVKLERLHLPVGQHLHERAGCDLRTAIP